MGPQDGDVRLLRILEAIADNFGLLSAGLSTDGDVRRLQLAERLARRYGLLPPSPSDPPTVPTVTKSIGTASRDYSTMTLWEADLDNGAIYASGDAAVGECYDDSVFDEAVTMNGGGTIGLTTVTLTVAVGQRHDGTSGTGARMVGSTSKSLTFGAVTSPQHNVSWLEWDINLKTAAFGITLANTDARLSNAIVCRLRRNNSAVTSGVAVSGRPSVIMNCIVYNVKNDHATGGAVGFNVGNNGTSGVTGHEAYNLTSDNITVAGSGTPTGFAILDLVNRVAKNIVSTNAGVCFDPASPATVVMDHNAASDTTASGTGSLDSITPANQYVSTTVGSEDYHLKSGADCIDAGTDLGTTPSGVQFDIDGRDRDAQSDTWDIGADEFVSASSFSQHFKPLRQLRNSSIVRR